MKKMIAAVLLAASGAAMAAGPYDGVYANLATAGSYISVHTNGADVIATAYTITPASGIQFGSSIGNVVPRQINTWELLQGRIQGNQAALSGQVLYNACAVELVINFTANGGTVQITNAAQTPVGSASGVRCQALVTGVPTPMTRIF
jgi:hypothetical protein